MSMPNFKACRYCKPPKRQPGCHATCKEYLDEKAAWEEEKKKRDAEREREGFLTYIEQKREIRMNKGKRR